MKNYIIAFLLFFSTSIFAQKVTISGTIIDTKTQKGIQGVVIKQENTTSFTETNNQGKFTIKTDENAVFLITHINYKSKKVALKNNIVVALSEKEIILDDIIITSNPLKDITQSTVILDNTKASSQPKNITDLFKEVNGFGVQKRGAYASEPVFRAFRYEQLNIQYDGASKIMNACPNRMDPITTHIIPEEIKKIELVKGPFTVRFGQNFGGIINLVSKEPNREKLGFKGSFETGYETNGNNVTTRGALQYVASKTDVLINGSYRKYGDYKDGNNTAVPSEFTTTDYSVKLGYNPTKNQRFKLSFRQSFGRDIDHAGLPMDSPYDDSYLVGLDYKINNVSNFVNSIIVKGFYSNVDHLMTNENRPNFNMVDARTNVFATTSGGKVEFTFTPNENAMLFVGLDANFINRSGNRIRTIKMMNGNPLPNPMVKIDKVWQDANVDDVGLFTELKYMFSNNTILTTGVRTDFISSSIKDPAIQMTNLYGTIDKKTEANFSGNIAVKHKFNSSQIQLAFGRGSRTASMVERYINHFSIGSDPYEYIGNPNLKPEVNNQVEFSYQKKFEKVHIGTSVFYSLIQDHITAFVNTNIPRLFMPMLQPQFTKQFINVNEATQIGFEFDIDYKATDALTFSSNIAYTKADNKEFNEPLAQIQPLTANIAAKLEKEKYWVKLNGHFVDVQNRISATFKETPSKAYTTFDVSAGVKPTKNLTIGVAVLNIFDKVYFDHLNFSFKNSNLNAGRILEPGRNITFYTKYKF